MTTFSGQRDSPISQGSLATPTGLLENFPLRNKTRNFSEGQSLKFWHCYNISNHRWKYEAIIQKKSLNWLQGQFSLYVPMYMTCCMCVFLSMFGNPASQRTWYFWLKSISLILACLFLEGGRDLYSQRTVSDLIAIF